MIRDDFRALLKSYLGPETLPKLMPLFLPGPRHWIRGPESSLLD